MPRTLSVESPAIPVVLGQPALEAARLSGTEGLNRLFEYELRLKTPDALNYVPAEAADFDLDAFIGREISCLIELDGAGTFEPGAVGDTAGPRGAGVRQINAIVTEAALWGEEGRHVQYRLVLRPWLHLATLQTDCRIFQDKTAVQILDELLADYHFPVEKRLFETYPVRDYQVQYGESDFAFFERICQKWGISWHFEHSEGKHRLVLSDAMAAYRAHESAAYGEVDYHAPGWRPDAEYVHRFEPVHRLTSGRYTSRDYDYTRPKADLTVRRKDPRPTGQADGEVYEWHAPGAAGSHYAQPRAGAADAANDAAEEGRQIALLRMQSLRTEGARAYASGNLRGMVPGCTFRLGNHPRRRANAEYLVLDTRFLIEDVAQDSQPRHAAEGRSQQWRVQVDFTAHPVAEPLRPALVRRAPRASGPVEAKVVGPAGENIWTDALGRIKVQFPWDRHGREDQNSSCWVRVSASWAGNQLGAIHIPRIGQEVLVSFLDGDPDRPVCTGRVYNQANLPPYRLPEQAALSGFRSRELGSEAGNSAAGPSNHILMDDTAGQQQVQIKSDHRHSSLSLGSIRRIEDNAGRKDARGEGFELRSDGHGAIRARNGLYISTEARERARAHINDMEETLTRLAAARDQHENLALSARGAEAQSDGDQDDVTRVLKAQNDAVRGRRRAPDAQDDDTRFPELSEPHLVLASPAGIESTTAGTTHVASDGHNAFTSGGHTSIAAGKSLLASVKEAIRLFAYQAGMRLTAFGGDIEIKALKDSIRLFAKLDITHSANRITIRAKEELRLEGGGSYEVLNAQGITRGTPGTHVSHATSHAFVGPDNVPRKLKLPVTQMKSMPRKLLLRLGSHAQNGHAYAFEPYELLDGKGARIGHGITDEFGQFCVGNHKDGTPSYEVRLTNGARFVVRVHERLDDSVDQRLASKGYRAARDTTGRHEDYGLDDEGMDA